MSSQSRIYAYILMLVHNHNDAEDLLQETASILWEKFDEYIPEKSFAAWAVGIARNKIYNFILIIFSEQLQLLTDHPQPE